MTAKATKRLFSIVLVVGAIAAAASAQNVTIAKAVFTGSGLNDATSGGAWTSAPGNHTYVVTISATGTPDHFTWTKDGGSASAPVAITGAAQTLSDGVTIKFAATTGHTAADAWSIAANANGSAIQSGFIATGYGAQFRSAQDKLRDVVSVVDFGAKGDGVTVDTVAVQNALNAVASGGSLVFPAGRSYVLGPLTVRTTNPVTISGYGATILPHTTGQYVFTVYGSSNKILGLKFVGTGGTDYRGIEITADATTIQSQFNVIKDVYMVNMYRGILDTFDAVGCPTCTAYRNLIVDTVLENFYMQKTWTGSFGISFDGTSNGNAGGNDSKVQGCGVKGYESNYVVRNSVSTKVQQSYSDGAANGFLYDGGSDLELDHVYLESNTNVVTTASTIGLPFVLHVYGGIASGFTNCVNGSWFQNVQPVFVGNASDSCFLPNIQVIDATPTGIVETPNTNGFKIGPSNLGSGATDYIIFQLHSGDWTMDLTNLNTSRNFILYRPGFPIGINTSNVQLDSLDLKFGTAATTHMQFPLASGLGSALHSNGGSATTANGLWIASNETAANVSGGTQANAALPSWAIDIGGFNGVTWPGNEDAISFMRKPAGGAYGSGPVFTCQSVGCAIYGGLYMSGGGPTIDASGVGKFAAGSQVNGTNIITTVGAGTGISGGGSGPSVTITNAGVISLSASTLSCAGGQHLQSVAISASTGAVTLTGTCN